MVSTRRGHFTGVCEQRPHVRGEIVVFRRHVDRGSAEGSDEEDSDVRVEIASRYGIHRTSASSYTRAGQGLEVSAISVSSFSSDTMREVPSEALARFGKYEADIFSFDFLTHPL